MNNTLIQDNFQDLMKMNDQDRKIVISYYETWSEQYPPEYSDGKTLGMKIQSQFNFYLYMIGISETEIDMDACEREINEVSSEMETDAKYVIDTWRGQWDNELFADLVENYSLVESK